MLLFPFINLGGVFLAGVLLLNAVMVLSEDRFLARIGWGNAPQDPGFGGAQDTTSIRARMIVLISSIRTVVRFPLIFINILVMIYMILLG